MGLLRPVAYSMAPAQAVQYVDWARRHSALRVRETSAALIIGNGVAEEKLALPPWLQLDAVDSQEMKEDPDFFLEPAARELMEYQREGIRFGIKRQGKVLLADDMGLGKTVQALGIAWQFRDSFPMLVIAPSSLRSVWEQQIAKWTSTSSDARANGRSLGVKCLRSTCRPSTRAPRSCSRKHRS